MSAALIVVVLVCGYMYINSHIPSKHQFKKSTGWQSYFQVAMKGAYYVSISFISLLILWLALVLVMLIFNIPLLFKEKPEYFTFAYDLLQIKFVGLGLPFVLLVIIAGILSFIESKNEEKKLVDPEQRDRIFNEIAQSNPIEGIILESFTSNQHLLVSITLKSRKVYVGMPQELRLEHLNTDVIVLIPFLSGYRDKDTLSFIEDVNYADHYQECSIGFDTQPLSLKQYRHVIPRDQIESVSLFNAEVYKKFKESK
ncbi:hypothetical protein V2154_02405 [Ewingella sp. CoE-038-23]|uniref:hypothetical protein n=1 Tax=Ewingella docleensis TaxID=3118588 RepID=UPI0033657E45